MKYAFVVLLAVFYGVNSQQFTKGKYDINLLTINECPDHPAAKGPITWTAKLRRDGDDEYVDGTVNVPFPVDHTIDVAIEVRHMKDGVWKPNFASIYKKDLCKSVHEYFTTFATKLFGDAGVKNPDKCPVEAGSYHLKDYKLPLHLIDQPFFYGEFMAEIKVVQNNATVVSCVDFHFEVIEPKKAK